MDKIAFGGIECISPPTKSFSDEFSLAEDYGEEQAFYVSNETFTHDEDDDLHFDYRYVIELLDLTMVTDEKSSVVITLYLVPTFGSICQSHKDSIMDMCGCGESSVCISDIMSEGGVAVPMAHTEISLSDPEEDMRESKDVLDILYAVASTYRTIDSLRGFYLDRLLNMIGTTGWDILYTAINGGNWLRPAINRAKEQMCV